MGYGCRVFVFDDDGTFRRLPFARFERLCCERGTPERFRDLAGRRARFALIGVELENRKPVGVVSMDFPVLAFDREGCLDAEEQRRSMMLAASSLPWPESPPAGVVRAGHWFASKRYAEEFIWQPTDDQVRELVYAAMGIWPLRVRRP